MNMNKKAVQVQPATESYVSGMPRETTKTFRMPEDLAYSLKKYAVETRQTEKDILVNLVTNHLKTVGAI